jgi:hypothetical protein
VNAVRLTPAPRQNSVNPRDAVPDSLQGCRESDTEPWTAGVYVRAVVVKFCGLLQKTGESLIAFIELSQFLLHRSPFQSKNDALPKFVLAPTDTCLNRGIGEDNRFQAVLSDLLSALAQEFGFLPALNEL